MTNVNKITSIYYSNIRESKRNILHPSLYKFIPNNNLCEQIRGYDLEKISKRKRGKKTNWGLEPHRLMSLNSNYISKNGTGLLTPQLEKWQVSYHRVPAIIPERIWQNKIPFGLALPNWTALKTGYVAGFRTREFNFAIRRGKDRYAFNSRVTVSQNHRNIHLQCGVRNFFGVGSIFIARKKLNTSRYTWQSNSIHSNYQHVVPKLQEMKCFGDKEYDKNIYSEAIMKWRANSATNITNIENINNVLDWYRYMKARGPSADESIPLVSGEWVAGVIDGDGGITCPFGSPVLQWSQKNPQLLYIINQYFNNIGNVRKKGGSYELEIRLDNPANSQKIFDFHSKFPCQRTDIPFKLALLKEKPNCDEAFQTKLPEYMPAMAIQAHAFLRRGGQLPDEFIECQHENYPQELGLYYKDVYKNIFREQGISRDILPYFLSILSFFQIIEYYSLY